MRKKIVAGNWKMNLNKDEAEALTTALVLELGAQPSGNQRVLICPPSVHLSGALALVGAGGRLEIGAQNMHQA